MICAGCKKEIDFVKDEVLETYDDQSVMDLTPVNFYGEVSTENMIVYKSVYYHKNCTYLHENKKAITEFQMKNVLIAKCVRIARSQNLSYEQCLELMVNALVKKSDYLENRLLELFANQGSPGKVFDEIAKSEDQKIGG